MGGGDGGRLEDSLSNAKASKQACQPKTLNPNKHTILLLALHASAACLNTKLPCLCAPLLRCKSPSMQVAVDVIPVVAGRAALALPALAAALTTALGAGERASAAAGCVLDALVAALPLAPVVAALAAAAVGAPPGARGRPALLERLAALAPQLQRAAPAAVLRLLLPAVLALGGDARAEQLRGALVQLLAVLQHLCGARPLLEAAAALAGPQGELRLCELLPGLQSATARVTC